MSGLLSSAAIMLKYAKDVSGSDSVGDVVNSTLKLAGDKKVQLMRADGSMMKVLGDYVVEPIAVVSDDLLDVEELDSILGLHMDMFAGYYMQIFDILLNVYNIKAEIIIDAMGTDNGGLSRLISKGSSNYAKTGNILSSECDDLHDWVGDLVRSSELDVTDGGQLVNISVEEDKPKHPLGRDSSRTPIGTSKAHNDLLIPNAIQRTLNVTMEQAVERTAAGKIFTRTTVIPILVKLAVIFTSKENIINSIEAKSDEYAFSSRLDDYRAGAISLTDFVFASDLINKYKNKKLKDTDGLLTLIQSRELSANSKMLTNDFAGFEKYYNMYLVSPDTKVAIERSVKAKLSTPTGKDRFLERANGLSVTVVDPDYERIQLMVKDTRGKTDLSFRGAVKKDKNGSDYSEIIKALLANKSPSF